MRNKTLKITLVILIIGSLLYAPAANAQIGNLIQGAACVGSGWLAVKITSAISSFLSSITSLILIDAVPVNDEVVREKASTLERKEYWFDLIARCTARVVFDNGIDGILNIIRNDGREGGATWVQNWRNFQTDSQYRGENIFRIILANTTLCNYIDSDIKNIFNAAQIVPLIGQNTRINNLDPFALRAYCNLPEGFDIEAFRQDFSGNGGWEAFTRMMRGSNNFYGAIDASFSELAQQRALEQSGDIYEATGQGFTGRRGAGQVDSCLIRGLNSQCVVYKNIKTPGSNLADSASNITNQELEWLVNSDELNEVLSVLIERIFNRLIDLGSPDIQQEYSQDTTP